MKILVKEEHEPEFLPVPAMDQDEKFVKDFEFVQVKSQPNSGPVYIPRIKEEVLEVKEEPYISPFKVKIKDEFPIDDAFYEQGDIDDPLSIQFSEKEVEPVMCNVAQLPMLSLMEKKSKSRNVGSSVASQNVHNNQNTSVATYDRSTVLGHQIGQVCQIKHKKTLPPNECTVGNNSDDYKKRFKEYIVTVRTLRECTKTELINKKIYECDTCHNCFKTRNILIEHLKIHTGEKNYNCNVCGKCFTQSSSLNVHLRIHTGEKNYKCNECGKCFTRSGNLKVHLRIHSGEKNYKCNECGKCFTGSGHLKMHLRIHSGEKNYKCNVCEKCFIRSDSLKKHLRIHSGDMNYKCIECGKCFTHSWSLKEHLRIHSGEKNYKCNECGKCFTRNDCLRVHLRIHSGEKNYKCNECGKCFARSDDLNNHLRIHYGDTNYKCNVCGKSFAHKYSIIRHLKVHSGEH